jgi:hypothetical protein
MLRRSIHGIILGSISCIFVHSVLAGDAIAIGYNTDGAWTAVTYNRSSIPKGGAHYRPAAEACTFALRDLRVRARDYYLARTAIVGESDRTGYVAVAQGKATARNKDVTAVGRGRRQAEAGQKALERLNATGITTDGQIVYRYFSYGADSGARRTASRHARRAHVSKAQGAAGTAASTAEP